MALIKCKRCGVEGDEILMIHGYCPECAELVVEELGLNRGLSEPSGSKR